MLLFAFHPERSYTSPGLAVLLGQCEFPFSSAAFVRCELNFKHDPLAHQNSHDRFDRPLCAQHDAASNTYPCPLTSTMSCCGEPKKPSLDEFNRPPPQQEFSGQQWVNQQPGPQPMLEKPPGMQQMNGGSYNSTEFHPPPLASPPPTMSFMNGSMNGSQVHMQYQQQQQQQQLPQGAWSPPPVHHTPSPPPTTSSPYQTTTAFSADSHSLRPSSLYQSSFGGMGPPAPISPPPMTATPFSSLPPTTRALPPDEGKMSVSIDFGAFRSS